MVTPPFPWCTRVTLPPFTQAAFITIFMAEDISIHVFITIFMAEDIGIHDPAHTG